MPIIDVRDNFDGTGGPDIQGRVPPNAGRPEYAWAKAGAVDPGVAFHLGGDGTVGVPEVGMVEYYVGNPRCPHYKVTATNCTVQTPCTVDVVVRGVDAGNHYRLTISGITGGWQIVREIAEAQVVLAGATGLDLTPGFSFALQASGSRLTAWFNDVQLAEVTDTQWGAKGNAGLRGHRASAAPAGALMKVGGFEVVDLVNPLRSVF